MVALTVMASFTTQAQAPGSVIVAGNTWLGGKGVDVHWNNNDCCCDYGSSYTVCPSTGASVYTGCEWQCVELPQRLYTTLGWHCGAWPVSCASQLYGRSDVGTAHANGSGYIPVPGDLIVFSVSVGSTCGHVTVVDHVDATHVYCCDENDNSTGRLTLGLSGSTLINPSWGTIAGTMHNPNNNLATTDGATFVSQTVANNTSFSPGQAFSCTFNMFNSGTSTWVANGASGYTFNNYGGTATGAPFYTPCSANVAPGANGAFTINFTAPTAAGTYTANFQMNNISSVYFGAQVAFTIQVATPGPVINTQPVTQTVAVGANPTFSVTASGSGLSYQWRKAGSNISGATASSYSLSNVQVADGDFYSVVVSNTGGNVTSANAQLVITQTSYATGTGTGLQGDYYDNLDFTQYRLSETNAQVNFDWGTGSPDPSIGNTTYSIRWTGAVQPLYTQTYTFYTTTDDGVRLWVNGTLLIDHWVDQSATEWSGSIALIAGTSNSIKMEYYQGVGTASAALSWSAPSQLKQLIPATQLYLVATPPSITTQPTSQTASVGANVTFSVAASGSPLSYQWTFNATNIAGATTSDYTAYNVQTTIAGNYAAVVTNAYGTLTSSNAVLTVIPAPSITTQPTNQAVARGATATFSVVAVGVAPLGYQWYFNTIAIAGATDTSYSKTAQLTDDGSFYYCIVTNGHGAVTSSIVTLTLTTTKVWVGAGADNNWSTTANWVGGVAPVTGDDIEFDGSTRLAPNMQVIYSLNSLTFKSGAGIFSITASASITLKLTSGTAGIVNNSANNQTLGMQIAQTTTKLMVDTGSQGKKITYTKALGNGANGADNNGMTVNGNGTFYVSSIGNASGGLSGVVTVNTNATLELQDYTSFGANGVGGNIESLTLDGGTIQVDASSAFQANLTGHFLCEDGVTLNVGGGTFAPQYAAIWSSVNLATPSVFVISGTGQLTIAGAGSLTMSSPTANTYSGGTVVKGTLIVSSASNLGANVGTAAVTVNSGGTLTLAAGVFPSAQKLLLQAGTPVVNLTGANAASQLSFDGGTTFQASGTWGSSTSGATHPDTRFTGSGTITIAKGPTSTAVSLTSGTTPSIFGASLTFTAAVTGSTPTGAVQFQDGGSNLGSAMTMSGGSAALTNSSLSVGTHSITAVYSGDAGNIGSTSSALSQVVNSPVPCSQTNALLSISANPNGTFRLAFIGTPQAAYCVISHTNVGEPLANWTVVAGSSNTVSDPGGLWSFTATNSSDLRFYRSAAVHVCP
jgi:PA14 domain/Bacterial Ig-like domain (group 3)/Ig-like domain from next to BRCA1 gene/CHAP domain